MPPPSSTSHLPASHPAARERPKSPTTVLADAEQQWLFTEAELANTPSIQDGMTQAEEKEIRAKGVNFIVQCGIMLKLPQLTLSTAATFLQRFFMRASFKKPRGDIPKLHQYQAAATALFLATKVEESSRKPKDMILAFCRVAQKNPNLIIDEQSKDWWRWRDCILHNEVLLLDVLCWDLTVEWPHRLLFEMLKLYGVEHNKRLRNAAWGFVTDSNNTQLCLLCTSRTIAVASLWAACRYCDVTLPDDAKGRPWWESQHVRLKEVRRAIEHMCASYDPASNKVNGFSASGSDGNGSIYMGLSTPAIEGADGWDSTRIRGSASPFPPLGSERRPSNASSIGIKREREEEAPTNGSQDTTNGVSKDAKDNKRPRLDDRTESNGKTVEAPPPPQSGANDDLTTATQREEKLRVENGNQQAELDIKAETVSSKTPTHEVKTENLEEGEVSEEGEVEE